MGENEDDYDDDEDEVISEEESDDSWNFDRKPIESEEDVYEESADDEEKPRTRWRNIFIDSEAT